MKGKLLITLVSLTIISLATSANLCSKYACNAEEKTNCATKSTKEEMSYTFAALCKEETEFCNYLKTTTQSPSVTCEKRKTDYRSYPGGECATDNDCINGVKCSIADKVCVKSNEGEECTKNADCIIGTFCNLESDNKKYCRKQRVDLECMNDYNCPNSHGCVDFSQTEGVDHGKCIEYYSVESGQKVAKNNNLSFCASSFAATETNEKGEQETYCVDAKLILEAGKTVKECQKDEDCVYEYTLNEKTSTTTYSGSCECGFGKEGKSYCAPANLNLKNYGEYIKKKKNLLNVSQCHTDERFSCSHILKETAYKFFDLKKTEVDVTKQHLLTGADSCVKDIVFPNYKENLILPKCPKFSCNETAEAGKLDCAISTGYASDSNYKVDIKACPENKICSYRITDFFKSDARTDTCIDIPTSKNFAYPGEKCSTNDDCIEVTVAGTTTKKCDETKKTCVGVEKTSTCLEDKDCVVGNYCFADPKGVKTCTALAEKTKACSKTTDCLNNLICFDKVCVEPYSQTLGTVITGKIEDSYKYLACDTFYDYHGICAEKRYDETRHTVNAGVVECGFGESCYYSITLNDKDTRTITEDCFCGFNENAKGYCPYSIQDYNKNRYNKIKDTYLSAINDPNNHTLNRKKYPSSESGQCLNVYLNSSYHNANDCILKVLGNGQCEDIPEDESSTDTSESSSSSESSTSSETTSSSSSSSFYGITFTYIALFLALVF